MRQGRGGSCCNTAGTTGYDDHITIVEREGLLRTVIQGGWFQIQCHTPLALPPYFDRRGRRGMKQFFDHFSCNGGVVPPVGIDIQGAAGNVRPLDGGCFGKPGEPALVGELFVQPLDAKGAVHAADGGQ